MPDDLDPDDLTPADLTPAQRVYFPPPPPDPDAHAVKRAVADDLRGLVDAVAFLDTAAVSPADLRRAADVVAEAHRVVTALASLRDTDREEWPIHEDGMAERGPVVGRANAVAPPMHLEHVGAGARGWAVFGPLYEGAPGRLHGGILAAAFDELLGCTQMAGNVMGPTGTLTIRYRNPTPIGERIDFEGHIDRVEGRKAYLVGTAHHGDTLLAEAEGIFIASAAFGPGLAGVDPSW